MWILAFSMAVCLASALQPSTDNNVRENRYLLVRNAAPQREVAFFSRPKFVGLLVASSLGFWAGMAENPEETCAATTLIPATNKASKFEDNPRYIERRLETVYATEADGKPRYLTVDVRRITGDATPYKFPETPIRLDAVWPTESPFHPTDFFKTDNNPDEWFYEVPKFVYHIDEPAVAALTQFYRRHIPAGSDVLDMCSSWTSHYPLEFPTIMKSIRGTGMNAMELQANDQFTAGYIVRNLNDEPTLPYKDNSFDVVTCVVSIDYLVDPIQILKEVRRVLRPGGKMIVSQSDRCFPTKAIAKWLRSSDGERVSMIDAFFHYAGGYQAREAYDIAAIVPASEREKRRQDPIFVVEAVVNKRRGITF